MNDSQAASILGKMAAGKPKKYSKTEIAIRTERIKAARKEHLLRGKMEHNKKV